MRCGLMSAFLSLLNELEVTRGYSLSRTGPDGWAGAYNPLPRHLTHTHTHEHTHTRIHTQPQLEYVFTLFNSIVMDLGTDLRTNAM